jgi:hypothetical protein
MKRNQHKRPKENLDYVKPGKTKGLPYKHIIGQATEGEREYRFHATKGYRSYTLSK